MINWQVMYKHMMNAIIKLEVEKKGLEHKLEDVYQNVIELNEVIDQQKRQINELTEALNDRSNRGLSN